METIYWIKGVLRSTIGGLDVAWQRVDDRKLEWDLMQAGVLYVKGTKAGVYTHYNAFSQESWKTRGNVGEWFGPDNKRENYIHVEE